MVAHLVIRPVFWKGSSWFQMGKKRWEIKKGQAEFSKLIVKSTLSDYVLCLFGIKKT